VRCKPQTISDVKVKLLLEIAEEIRDILGNRWREQAKNHSLACKFDQLLLIVINYAFDTAKNRLNRLEFNQQIARVVII
jgi:hypothetical protein